jgi:CubicO group peptidase (beta-lactamase class C family)
VQARGVHGQLIHVAPEADTVIVMLSSWPDAEGGAANVGHETQQILVRAIEDTID